MYLYDRKTYKSERTAGTVPVLSCGKLYDKDTAYIGVGWWGYLIKVNLDGNYSTQRALM